MAILCGLCRKNEAVCSVTLKSGAEEIQLPLCRDCMQKVQSPQLYFLPWIFQDAAVAPQKERKDDHICPQCGMRFEEIAASGKVGCATCYTTFRKELEKSIAAIHKTAVQHVGKVAKSSGATAAKQRKIQSLQDALAQCVKEQRFEEAAQLRDEIRALESGEEHV